MHVCLFDIDGTLLNSGGAGQAAMEAALAEEFGVTHPVEGISTAGRTDHAITRDLFGYYGLHVDDEVIARFVACYLRHLPTHLATLNGMTLPGVPELLQTLAARDDVMLGLLTGNYRDGAHMKLKHFGLHDHFPFGGFGDHHPSRDDVAREALAEAQRSLGRSVDLERLWVIGDTVNDVKCGRAIGARVIAVATGLIPAEDLERARPDHLFDDFSDPDRMLTLLL